MDKPILYLVGRHPSLTETFIHNEVEGLRRLGLTIDIQGLVPLRPLRSLGAIAKAPLRSLMLWRYLALPGFLLAGTKLWFRALQVLDAASASGHIHAHFLGYPATIASALAKAVGVNYSLTAHAHDIYVSLTHPSVIRDASFRITCTEANRQYLHERYPEWPFELVRHGLNVTDSPPVSRGPSYARILAVGRCVEKKGFTYLLDACAHLRQEGLPFMCTLVGNGPELAPLREKARRLGIARHIRFPGALPHDQVMSLYLETDMLVAPSVIASNGDRDGIPNTLLEAMARRVPVISTDVGGIPELVQNERTGLVVPPRDSLRLADAIRRVCTDHPLRETLAEEARLTLQREFAPELWLPRLRNLFRKHAGA